MIITLYACHTYVCIYILLLGFFNDVNFESYCRRMDGYNICNVYFNKYTGYDISRIT